MKNDEIVARLLSEHGRTYAQEAGITLLDEPAPLYQLLVLTVLCSTRIRAEIATGAARELFAAGLRTPRAMAESDRQDRVDALGRAGYVRYDESTATALGKGAELVLERWHGDLRRMGEEAGDDPGRLGELLQEFPRIGPTGAAIFRREVQAVWPWLRPFFDERSCATAESLGLPHTPRALGALVASKDDARLAAALVRVGLSKNAMAELRAACRRDGTLPGRSNRP